MSYVFVFRASPDIDHMAPVAWKLLEEGEPVHAVLSSGLQPDGDHRIELLRCYPRFRLHRSRSTLLWAMLLLRRTRASLLAVEWGFGLPASYDAFPRPAGLWAAMRSLVRSVLKGGRDSRQIRLNFTSAAALLRVPTVCLPHGLNITHGLEFTTEPRKELVPTLDDIEPHWESRNRFAAYVFNTEHHRRWHLEHRRGDAAVMQTWGSVRWSPEWFELNRRLAPEFTWPEPADGRVRLAFMLPRWKRGPDGAIEWGGDGAPDVAGDHVIELVRRLHTLPDVSLAVAAHPRSTTEADPIHNDASIDAARIHDVTGTNSVSLIAAADVVIDAGSSIGLEVVLQKKVLVVASFLYAQKTLFDAIPGACVLAEDVEQAVTYVRAHASGSPQRPRPEALEELMRRAIYGDRSAPFDVLDEYVRRMRELSSTP